jgi:hypothetical protein
MYPDILQRQSLPERSQSVDEDYRGFNVDRCLSSNGEVMFLHLGRGIPKTQKTYHKSGKVDVSGWIEFCEGLLH